MSRPRKRKSYLVILPHVFTNLDEQAMCSTILQRLGASVINFLPLKAITKRPAQFFIDNCEIFDEPHYQKLPVGDDDFFGDLDVIFNSVTHLGTSKDILEKLFYSIFIYQCLVGTGYFNNIKPEGNYHLLLMKCLAKNRSFHKKF